MKTEKLIYFALVCIAGYFAVHSVMTDDVFIRYGVGTGLICVSLYGIFRLGAGRYLQRLCTRLRLITIVSVYSVTGRYTFHQKFTHLESRVYFFWIPRLNVLSAGTVLAMDYIEKTGLDIKVLEERWVGEYEK